MEYQLDSSCVIISLILMTTHDSHDITRRNLMLIILRA